jgi:hypothetical protein
MALILHDSRWRPGSGIGHRDQRRLGGRAAEPQCESEHKKQWQAAAPRQGVGEAVAERKEAHGEPAHEQGEPEEHQHEPDQAVVMVRGRGNLSAVETRELVVEAERQVILEEILMNQDLPDDHVHTLLDEALFPGHPLGREVLGRRLFGRFDLFAIHAVFVARGGLRSVEAGLWEDGNVSLG